MYQTIRRILSVSNLAFAWHRCDREEISIQQFQIYYWKKKPNCWIIQSLFIPRASTLAWGTPPNEAHLTTDINGPSKPSPIYVIGSYWFALIQSGLDCWSYWFALIQLGLDRWSYWLRVKFFLSLSIKPLICALHKPRDLNDLDVPEIL